MSRPRHQAIPTLIRRGSWMHQYSSTSARKAGCNLSVTPLTGTRFAIRPRISVSMTNHGLTGSRISSGRARANEGRCGMCSLAAMSAAALAWRVGFSRLFRSLRRRRGAAEDKQVRALLYAGERLAGHAGENLAGLALDRNDLRDREARGIRAVDAGCQQLVA